MKKQMTVAKWAGIGGVGALLAITVLLHYSHTHTSAAALQGNNADSDSAVVHASNDEDMRYLTAKMGELTNQNKEVIKENEYLKNKVNQTGNMQLSQTEDKLEKLMQSQAAQIDALRNQINQVQSNATAPIHSGQSGYLINGTDETNDQSTVSVNGAGQMITTVRDMSLPPPTKDGKSLDNATLVGYQPILTGASVGNNAQSRIQVKKPKSTPYFTIPANATLSDVVLDSDIMAEVPKSNTLLQPAFQFKAIVGNKDLLASNGITLPPNLNGIVFEGYSVGTMPPMSCARGYITKMLFTWSDGSFTVVGKEATGTELNPTDTLGYISSPYGNPCIPGQFITDANEVLPNLALLGGLTNGGIAVAQAQQSVAQNGFQGGSTTAITGSLGKYMLASTVAGGSQDVQNWYMSRVNSTFDVVYIPSSQNHTPTPIVVNITKTIDIDKNQKGRKINYEQDNQNTLAVGNLD